MTQDDILYKSIYNFIYKFSDYDTIKNNEERLIAIIYKNSTYLKTTIKSYISSNYNDNYININNIFRDRQLKKLIKGQTVYDEMLKLIEKKNKEIEDLKRKLELKE
uniref:Uncharacterized protein n=1 Tax=viral metagenome TaxID=1070528 RepID=A0A6C0EQX0_9ZZZZ